MKLLGIGVGPVEDKTISHIKDALSRIIVEMVKREWPQQWTSLLAELSEACTKGEAQTEIVLLVFLRLVEDVALLQVRRLLIFVFLILFLNKFLYFFFKFQIIESNQRRKDIYQALTVNMNEIFAFFLRLIELHVSAFRSTTAVGNQQKAEAHSRVVQVVLLTLTGFVEWVSIVHIMADEGRLLQILCILLNDAAFQIPAAECLSQIVNRKGQIKERKPLMCLFNATALQYIFDAVSCGDITTEENYAFLKKMVQVGRWKDKKKTFSYSIYFFKVLTGLASQITTLWGKEDNIQPAQLAKFLETLFICTRHPSITITQGSCSIWLNLLKHDQITKEPTFLECISKLVEIIGPKVLRVNQKTVAISNSI